MCHGRFTKTDLVTTKLIIPIKKKKTPERLYTLRYRSTHLTVQKWQTSISIIEH